jgi:transposase
VRAYGASRAEMFAQVDAPALKPLPAEPYAFATWKRCRVAPDYHVEAEGCFYSVPYRLIGEALDVRIAERTIEAFHRRRERVASHARSPGRRGHITVADHMPSAHRRHAAWTPARMMAAADKIGPAAAARFPTPSRASEPDWASWPWKEPTARPAWRRPATAPA